MTTLPPAEHSARRLWTSVGTLALAETVSWGVLFYSFGVLLPAMEEDLGVSRTWLTTIFSGTLLVASFTAPIAGRLIDRRGARPAMTLGAVAASVLVALWPHVGSITTFALVWLGIGVTHAFVLYEPAFIAVTRWFTHVKTRSRALMTITLVAGLASTVFFPLTGALVEARGWRETATFLAIILAVVTIPIHFALPSVGAAAIRERHKTQLVSPPGFGWLIITFVLQGFLYATLVVHAVPIIAEAGRTTARAAALAGTFGIFQVLGRLFVSTWWERTPPPWRVPTLILGQTLSVSALFFAANDAAVWAFVVLFGVSNGLLTLARPLVVAEWNGTANFGAASGRVAGWSQGARSIGPALASALHGINDSYRTVLIALSVFGLAAILASLRADALRARGSSGVTVSEAS
jgi:MFS family permease